MSDKYKLTVGLEIHAELNTRTKMFCDSKNSPDEEKPNVNVCPVCMGHPGTLPVINSEAVKSILRLGVAVGGKPADYTEFDRKNYFYPDIPKGYQISQYAHPLVKGGELSGVRLTRVHLEEDTAKSIHNEKGESLLNFNRAGVPLMELVTEPVIETPEKASRFAKELQLMLNYLGIAEANMEKGEMRVEANISVSATEKLGTKVEVKNLNSFRAVEKAIRFEMERHISLLEKGEKVTQETRGWNEDRGETFSQRLKEESHDYRYFPDPDLPKLFISEIPEFSAGQLRATLPELPYEKRARLIGLGIPAEQAETYVTQGEWGSYFDEVAKLMPEKELLTLASNYIANDLKKPLRAEALVELIKMIKSGDISSRGAKEILKVMEEFGGEPKKIAEEKKLMQESDREVLQKIVDEVKKENPGEIPAQFLVGQAMKKSGGRANPVILQELINQK
jgi:aspartyl-tRNA(Asn)/glutamyl-tRNA(Gln) amidotransferase subunit B